MDNTGSLPPYLNHRWVETPNKKELHESRLQRRVSSHVSPFSTLIAAMGNYWAPGCLEAVQDMEKHTAKSARYDVCLYEERDRCDLDFDAMGSMRNEAYLKALREGWEYILYIDNDVLPMKDALVRLLGRFVPIISPIVSYADGHTYDLFVPSLERNKGMVMIGSCVLSFLLIRTTVFFPWALGGFWGNALGDDEEYHFHKFEMSGHHVFIDTDVEVVCQNPPHFPLGSALEARRERYLHSTQNTGTDQQNKGTPSSFIGDGESVNNRLWVPSDRAMSA